MKIIVSLTERKDQLMKKAIDKQVGGDHYKTCKIQPVEYIECNQLGFLMGNVVKYVTRYAVKSNVQDLEKAKHYIELQMQLLEEGKL
jgi:hypothetical protein|tara:strand:+ start:754 stop:1014 length:261 start_codon:yes stop_codon:yes gene_type:complete